MPAPDFLLGAPRNSNKTRYGTGFQPVLFTGWKPMPQALSDSLIMRTKQCSTFDTSDAPLLFRFRFSFGRSVPW